MAILLSLSNKPFIFSVRFFNFYRFLKIKFNLGGRVGGRGAETNLVAKMDENGLDRNIWTKMGSLLTTREGHRSIVLHNKIVHVGGDRGMSYDGEEDSK